MKNLLKEISRKPNSTERNRTKLILIILFGVLLLSTLIFWGFPSGLALYFQQSGGAILNETLNEIFPKGSAQIACSNRSNLSSAVNPNLFKAISMLDRSVAFGYFVPYTHFLLGKVYCLLGKYEQSIQNLNAYIELRPKNPLGQIELGFAYEAVGNLEYAKKYWTRSGLKPTDFLQVGAFYRKNGAFEAAQIWETRARIYSDRSPDTFSEPASMNTEIIENFSTLQGWFPYLGNSTGVFTVEEGILTMKYVNEFNGRDSFSWSTQLNIPVVEYESLKINLYGKEGTYLTVETVIDGERTREINYMPVPQDWEVLTIPISGNDLQEIIIGIGEAKAEATYPDYEVKIEWIGIQ